MTYAVAGDGSVDGGAAPTFSFDNTAATYNTIVAAIAVRHGAGPPTITPSVSGSVLLDHVSADETDFREYFHLIENAPAAIITWTVSGTCDSACTILSHTGPHKVHSTDFGYNENPAPTWDSVTLPDADDDLFGFTDARGNHTWYATGIPSGVTVLTSGGTPMTAACLIWDQQPAGATGNFQGSNADGRRSWATLLIAIRQVADVVTTVGRVGSIGPPA